MVEQMDCQECVGYCSLLGGAILPMHMRICRDQPHNRHLVRQRIEQREGADYAEPTPGFISTGSIGTNLKHIIRREVGSLPCQSCVAEIQRLDGMSAAEVNANREQIVDGIMERGRHQLKWWSPGGFAIRFTPGQVRALVESWIDEAVTAAKPPD